MDWSFLRARSTEKKRKGEGATMGVGRGSVRTVLRLRSATGEGKLEYENKVWNLPQA